MPWMSLGTRMLHSEETSIPFIQKALTTGYHAIDTSTMYKNEKIIGQSLKKYSMQREDLFLTAKVAPKDQGYTSTLAAFRTSMLALQVDYIDLYLIHWPKKGLYKETWRALERLYRDGFVRAIGVCHFTTDHLKELMKDATIKPMINQVELCPRNLQSTLRTFCTDHHIQLQSYRPLMHRKSLLSHPLIVHLAQLYNKTPAQIILRWHIQHHIACISSSTTLAHLKENQQIFDFTLSLDDLTSIHTLHNKYQNTPTKLYDYWSVYFYRYTQRLREHLQR